MTDPTDEGPDLVTERFTTGGPGPEGQPDTVDETASSPASSAEAESEPPTPKARRKA